MLPNGLVEEGPEELFPRAHPPIMPPPGHFEPPEKQLIDEAMEAGRGQMAAIVLHNIGNAITPIRVHLDHMRGKQLLQVTGYLEKCFRDLETHRQDLQRYIQENTITSVEVVGLKIDLEEWLVHHICNVDTHLWRDNHS